MRSSVSRDWRALGVVQPSRAVCDTAVQSELHAKYGVFGNFLGAARDVTLLLHYCLGVPPEN